MKMTRRELIWSLAAGAYAAEKSPVTETQCGRIQGASFQGVHIFRGIPYGTPARFLQPSKAASWAGTRDTTETGPRSIQGPGNIFRSPLIGEYFAGGRPDRVPLSTQTDSENCLNLNVLTTGLGGSRP